LEDESSRPAGVDVLGQRQLIDEAGLRRRVKELNFLYIFERNRRVYLQCELG